MSIHKIIMIVVETSDRAMVDRCRIRIMKIKPLAAIIRELTMFVLF